MSLTDVLNVTVSVSAASPSAAGFGEPLLFGYHTYYTDLVREYSTLGGMVSDGFKVTDPLYLMASALHRRAPPSPSGRSVGASTHSRRNFKSPVLRRTPPMSIRSGCACPVSRLSRLSDPV